VSDAQTWTAIGGLLAVIFAFVGLIIRLFGDIDGLDRDVAAITRRLLDGPQ
jgi:hypothetical protein